MNASKTVKCGTTMISPKACLNLQESEWSKRCRTCRAGAEVREQAEDAALAQLGFGADHKLEAPATALQPAPAVPSPAASISLDSKAGAGDADQSPPLLAAKPAPAKEVNVKKTCKDCGKTLRKDSPHDKCPPCRTGRKPGEKSRRCPKCGRPMYGEQEPCRRCRAAAARSTRASPSKGVERTPAVSRPKVRTATLASDAFGARTDVALERTSTADLVSLLKACRAELQRRKDELEAALAEAA